MIKDVRDNIHKEEPALDIEVIQLLQDMIGDLSNQPEDVVIKLFSQDPKLLQAQAPRVADAISKVKGVVDLKNGIENTISGPATQFNVNPTVAAKGRLYRRRSFHGRHRVAGGRSRRHAL